MSLLCKPPGKHRSLFRSRLFSRSNPLVGYFVYPRPPPAYDEETTKAAGEEPDTQPQGERHATPEPAPAAREDAFPAPKAKARRWFARGRCSARHRERVLNRRDPYVGYFAHSKSRKPFALDPSLRFLSDCEGSIGTPSCCGSDFDYDDVELDRKAEAVPADE